MAISKKFVQGVKKTYYDMCENYYPNRILEYIKRSKEDKNWKDRFILTPLQTHLDTEFWDEQIIGLRDEGFDYRYRCTERWWGYLDSMYRYEIERILEGGVDIGWHIERMRKVYGEEVWSEEIEEILRRVYERKDEVFNDMMKQRYKQYYYALSIFFDKRFIILEEKKENIKNIEEIRSDYKKLLEIKLNEEVDEELLNDKEHMKYVGLYKRYLESIYRKELCKEVKKAYKEYVKIRKSSIPSLYSHYKDYDPQLVRDYQFGVKQGYGECIKDVTDNDKIVYRKEFLENPLFG